MTHYITGDCDTPKCLIDHERGSFSPPTQHVFKEIYPPTYVEIVVVNEQGIEETRVFDMCSRGFVDGLE